MVEEICRDSPPSRSFWLSAIVYRGAKQDATILYVHDVGDDGDESTRLEFQRTQAAPPHSSASCAESAQVASAGPCSDASRYQLGEEHARGGVGRVVNAYDTALERAVVVKELLKSRADLRSRFQQEVLITANLQHPSIVPIYDLGVQPDGSVFYVMKKVAGRSLNELIDATSSLEQRLALLPKMVAVAEAIAYAHSRGVIHRDLKPANVMVGEYGETIVIDWGLAKILKASNDADAVSANLAELPHVGATVAGQVLGTPAYMPPEQARGAAVDERADVYALGAMLYHLLSGCGPHAGRTSDEVLRSAAAGHVPSISQMVDDLPLELVRIVDKAMAGEVGERYRDAGELADDLERYQSHQLIGSRVVESMRKTRVERHALWRELFTSIGGGRAPLRQFVFLAWAYLLVAIPLIYVPVAAELLSLRAQSESVADVRAIWFGAAIGIVVANLFVVAIGRRGEGVALYARYASSFALTCNVACVLLSSYEFGLVTSPASFFLLMQVLMTRVVCDYQFSVLALIVSVIGYALIATLEQIGCIAAHPAVPHAAISYYEVGINSWVVVLPSLVGMVAAFAIVNYSVNQSVKLQRYVTDSVFRRFLPAPLVAAAARGDLSNYP